MSGYNRITLVGILKEDPKSKTLGKKTRVTFPLEVERHVEREHDTFNIVAWGKLGEVCRDYLVKGKKILLDGHLQVRTVSHGETRQWITEIITENIKFLPVPKEV